MDCKAMKTYEVQTTNTMTKLVTVEAENEEAAIAAIAAGKGVEVDNQLTVTRSAHARPDAVVKPSSPSASSPELMCRM